MPARFQPFGARPYLAFALMLVLPAVLLVGLGGGVLMLTIGQMGANIDRASAEHEVAVVGGALGMVLDGVERSVVDEGTWTGGYLKVVVAPDPAWMDETWGAATRGGIYDAVIVTDQMGNISFGENRSGSVVGSIVDRYPSAAAILAQLDTAIADEGDNAVTAQFATGDGGVVALGATSIHQATHGAPPVPVEQRRILWLVTQLDYDILGPIAERFHLPSVELGFEVQAGKSHLKIADIHGEVVGVLNWEASRPGGAMAREVLLGGILGIFGMAVLALFGLVMLLAAMMRREKLIEAVFAKQSTALSEARNLLNDLSDDLKAVNVHDCSIAYQPIVDTQTDAVTGARVLLRWTYPDGRSLLEENLKAEQIAYFLKQVAASTLRQVLLDAKRLGDIFLVFSVPAELLGNAAFLETVAGTLRGAEVAPERLCLALDARRLPPIGQIGDALMELRASGVQIELHDFVLSDTTVDYLSPGLVDRASIGPKAYAAMDFIPARRRLAEASIAAAVAARLPVTAWGLTQKEAVATLEKLGCTTIRADFVAPPLDIAALEKMLTIETPPPGEGAEGQLLTTD